MNRHFYIPSAFPLQNVIHSFWQVERVPAQKQELIIPKGIVEIIFNFSDPSSLLAKLDSKCYQLSNCFINGFNTAPIQLHLPQRQVFFGVGLQPLALKKLYKIPAGEFSDTLVDITLLDASFHSLWHQLAKQAVFEGRVAIFCRWLERKFVDWQPQEKLLNQFLYALHGHEVSVKELAHTLCYSSRHLTRKILEATEMNTEELLLYKKYLYAVHLIHHTDLSLTEIAYQSHFSDQSHFIKTFKAYTHMTPGEYKRNKSDVKGHIYENVPPENVR